MAGEPEQQVFGPLEPEQLPKKSGAGAAMNMLLLYRLLENKCIRKFSFCNSYFGSLGKK